MMTKRFYLAICVCIACAMHCFAQTVSDVRFEQVDNKVKITYSLDKQADISVCVSDDGGKTWSSPLKQVSGDVGTQVQPGSKTIWWDALSEYDQLVGTHLCFKVTPWSGGNLTFTVNGETFTMVYVQGGTFTMGATAEQRRDAYRDEKYAHKVTLSSYYIGEYEVTQGLWETVMGTTIQQQRDILGGYKYYSLHGVGREYPMYYVSWKEATEFCCKLSVLTGRTFALPTEAQWEYAAKGGNNQKIDKDRRIENFIKSVAWCSINSNDNSHPVGTKRPNTIGLYDMMGNVWEWCSDCYDSSLNMNLYGRHPEDCRMLRGGGWDTDWWQCNFCCRSAASLYEHSRNHGFRIVLLE